MKDYTEDELVRQRGRLIVLQRSLVTIAAVVIVISFGVLLFSAVQGFFARQELLSCTTPEGECYKKGQENTARIVDSIVTKTIENARPLHIDTRQVAILAAYCADKPGSQTPHEIQSCIYTLAPALDPRKR